MLAEPSSSPIAALAMNGGPVEGLHKTATESIQIPQVKTPVKDDESIASGSTDSQSHFKKRLSADMSKEQVEDLVKKLTLDEMKSKWFDEIFEKVKSELVEEHSPADTPSSSEPTSPMSDPAPVSPHQSTSQEPVRDDPKKHEPMPSPHNPKSRPNDHPSSSRSSLGSPTTSYISDSASSRASNHDSSSPPKPAPKDTSPPPKTRPCVRFSKAPIILNEGPEPRHSKPRPSSQPPPAPEPIKQGPTLSAVDLKWGRLFDDKGEPTERLGQVLRGIANYLIAEYSPHNSLVITPEKLNVFYHEYKLDAETFPFQQIFDCRPHGALDNLETLYQHLRCENHLIQRRPGGMPHIPSLTPAGFERWMACQIRAFPDQEAKRLNHIMTDLPITADGALVDDKPERLPKQISRHLLPANRHRETHDLVVDAITGWIKHTEENESDFRRTSSEDVYKGMMKDEKSGRYRPDDHRDRDSKYRRGSKDHRQSPMSRSDPSGRFVSRVGSESTIRPSKDSPVSPSSSHRARSPVSNRYRHSTPILESSSSTADPYDIPSSSHRSSYPSSSSSSRRNREKEYRYSSSPKSKSPLETTPRTLPRRDADRRSSLIFEETGKDPNGMTYDEYLRMNQRPLRNAVVDDGGHYRY
ncbi:hypothetical protein F53441_5668 [Fusarium austroafricanum]|uniref:DUF7514 domain-containing protein n=1 Tax=Fusarium austroafricanum TaxID=2364996 RepID=A0A8H4KHP1_9HYPO|nr:hypothetical protein F53441_5668 [Fusarium austroafricanum]